MTFQEINDKFNGSCISLIFLHSVCEEYDWVTGKKKNHQSHFLSPYDINRLSYYGKGQTFTAFVRLYVTAQKMKFSIKDIRNFLCVIPLAYSHRFSADFFWDCIPIIF